MLPVKTPQLQAFLVGKLAMEEALQLEHDLHNQSCLSFSGDHKDVGSQQLSTIVISEAQMFQELLHQQVVILLDVQDDFIWSKMGECVPYCCCTSN
jgi:hypothetical protein